MPIIAAVPSFASLRRRSLFDWLDSRYKCHHQANPRLRLFFPSFITRIPQRYIVQSIVRTWAQRYAGATSPKDGDRSGAFSPRSSNLWLLISCSSTSAYLIARKEISFNVRRSAVVNKSSDFVVRKYFDGNGTGRVANICRIYDPGSRVDRKNLKSSLIYFRELLFSENGRTNSWKPSGVSDTPLIRQK